MIVLLTSPLFLVSRNSSHGRQHPDEATALGGSSFEDAISGQAGRSQLSPEGR